MGLFLFILKKYVEGLISLEFQKKAKAFDSLLELNKKVQEFTMDKQLGIYPEIHELLYRLRNIMKDGLEKENAYTWDPAFRPLCAHLTENLFKYRIFLPQPVFEALHDYKHVAQNALMLVDICTRKDNLFDKEQYAKHISDFKRQFEESEKTFEFIDSTLREKLNIK